MKTILVIDDDVNIGNMLEEILTREGFAVRRAYSGTEAKLVLSGARPDLILLDLMLPGLNGEELLPEIKNIPVIVISAKAGIDDKVSLLAGGAVDYVTKPFDTRELLARINVQMRKSGTAFGESLKYGDIVLEADIHSVSVCQKPVRLTPTEYAILKLLMRNL